MSLRNKFCRWQDAGMSATTGGRICCALPANLVSCAISSRLTQPPTSTRQITAQIVDFRKARKEIVISVSKVRFASVRSRALRRAVRYPSGKPYKPLFRTSAIAVVYETGHLIVSPSYITLQAISTVKLRDRTLPASVGTKSCRSPKLREAVNRARVTFANEERKESLCVLGEAERLAKRLYEQDLRVNPVRQWNDVPVPESFVGRKALRHEAAPLLLPTVAMRYEIKII